MPWKGAWPELSSCKGRRARGLLLQRQQFSNLGRPAKVPRCEDRGSGGQTWRGAPAGDSGPAKERAFPYPSAPLSAIL